MTDWVAERFSTHILIVMRHPCGFASSLESLDWKLSIHNLLRQDKLMQDHLEDFRDVLEQAGNDKWLTRGALWGAVHTVYARQMVNQPDWRLIKYEDLCADPAGQFEALANEFDLELSIHTRQKIKMLSSTASKDSGSTQRNSRLMPGVWRQRMSPGEIDAVMGIVAEFGLEFYT